MGCPKVACHAFVVSELAAIVVGGGMNKVNKGREQFCNGITDRLSRPMNNPPGMTVYNDFRSASVTKAPWCCLAITVSPSQSP